MEPRGWVDTHLHGDRISPEEWPGLLSRAHQAGVIRGVAVGSDGKSGEKLLRLQQAYPNFIAVAFGYHPEQSVDWEQVEIVLRQIREHRDSLCGVGEVGLPWYTLSPQEREKAPDPEHLSVLERFLQTAVELDLPVLLHAVHDRAETVFRMLQTHHVRKAVFHWLKAPAVVVDAIVGAGYYVSVTPEVCYRQRDRELVQRIPTSSLLLETDAPWRYSGPFRGRPAEPAWVGRTAEAVSQVQGISLPQLVRQTTANACRLFGWSLDQGSVGMKTSPSK